MDADLLARVVLPWLATWFAHSTVLLLVVWGLTRVARRMAPATQVALWRAALFGPLLTASLPFVLALPTPVARIALPAAARVAAPTPDPIVVPVALAPTVLPPAARTLPVPVAVPVDPLREAVPVASAPAGGMPVTSWIVLAWCALAALLALRSAVASRRVRLRLAARRRADDPALDRMLGAMADRAGLRRTPPVTVSDAVYSPVAWGVLRPEICVPERALRALTSEQQEAMLAHELGHIVRRDALWLALERWLSSLFFFQPLFVLARRRLRESTELACDQLAIALTARPLALAECLAEVAGWVSPRARPVLAPAMASTPSLLARRVERLLDVSASTRRRSGAAVLGALALLAAVALLGPGFRDGVPALRVTEAGTPHAPDVAPIEPAVSGGASLHVELRAIDKELALVRESLTELEGLADALDTHSEVRAAVRRLVDRSKTLFERRDALVRAALGENR